ncbi:MAG: HAD-IIIA family hydrolase [Coxiellaceae bacterium]|jgi:3-deoxy-D-manno-octulosonate 8-phosphate phosphatase (KDO 8-P phosphatase)|nr:HAD-IIIA family hydrolase [Coxiellaceae bacterium]
MKMLIKLNNLDIKLLVLDVDGVLTNGKLYSSDNGMETKSFHIHDGMGLKLLLKHNIIIVVISGRKSQATKKRMRELGIKHVYLGIDNKLQIFNRFKKQFGLKKENIACVGDDLPDIPLMKQAGFSIAVANATHQVQKVADYITKNKGGQGAVREVCDLILQVQEYD